MDTGAALIGLGFILIMLTPFILYFGSQKIKAMRLIRQFNDLSRLHKMSLSKSEIWDKNYAIGIDIEAKKILYINRKKDHRQEVLIDLSNVVNCRISNGIKSNQTGSEVKSLNDKLGLELTFSEPATSVAALEFFDGDALMSYPDGELEIAERWVTLINSCLLNKN
jgi:hypothetical protein